MVKVTEDGRVWDSHSGLYPLQPDVHGTKRWNYSGKNLSLDEVEVLTKKGVDWIEDVMPDGRLKLPRHRIGLQARRRKALNAPLVRSCEREEQRWQEYMKLPEPRPDFFEFAALRDRRIHFDALERIAMHSRRNIERIKALSTILEFGKSKPKQVMEIESKPPESPPLDINRLLQIAVDFANEQGINLAELQAQSKPMLTEMKQ